MKRCAKCGIEKSRSEFSRRTASKDGLCYLCKECDKKASAKWRKENPEYPAKWAKENPEKLAVFNVRSNRKRGLKYPERVKARSAVSHALRDGRLHKHPCSCGKTEVEGHHWSYEEEHWLDVEWLCIKCHRKLHKGND